MAKQRWRLIIDGDRPGGMNMALDEAMLEAYLRDESPPTLRLYGWKPAALSLGYSQPVADVDLPLCQAMGVDLVRRPTGGRAVLHQGERTYALVAGRSEGFPESVAATYRRVCEGLAIALRLLGLEVAVEPGSRTRSRTASCFQTATLADLSIEGKKIAGSAQVRRLHGFLQHGSLLVTQPPGAAESLLGGATVGRVTNLSIALGRLPSRQEIDEAITNGMEHALGISLEPGDYSPFEQQVATTKEQTYVLLGPRPAPG